MSIRLDVRWLLAALLLTWLAASGVPAADISTSTAGAMGPVADPGTVMTPFGPRDRAHVHTLLPGQKLRHERDGSMSISDAQGRLLQRVLRGAVQAPAQVPGSASAPGWVTAAYWPDQVPQPVTSFQADWQVPLPPLEQENQLIYLFDGLLDMAGSKSGIIQPVLQWGCSNFDGDPNWGGNYWTIASWYVTGDTEVYHTVPVVVYPGQVLTGLMLQSKAGNSYDCICAFNGFTPTLIEVSNPTPFAEPVITLEAYNLSQPNDYPQTELTAFVNIQLKTTAGPPATPWLPWMLTTTYGEHTVIANNSATAGAIALFYHPASRATAFDFDGDGKADCGIYRPADGAWYMDLSDGGVYGTLYGYPDVDLPIPADYEGGGISDVAVYRPTSGQWYTPTSLGNPYGIPGDVPIPGDYLNQGYAQEAVFRTSTAQWFTPVTPTGLAYGWVGHDVPVPADYLGTGQTDIAVYRPDTGQWFTPVSPTGLTYGWALHDLPVPADYDGVGHAEITVYRPDTGQWFINGHSAPITWGIPFLDIPVPADYDGVGHDEIAVYRPTTGQFLIAGHATPIITPAGAPQAGDVPLSLPLWYRFHPY